MPQAAWCIKCDKNIFATDQQSTATHTEKKKFIRECVPKALNATGFIKKDFECSGNDQDMARRYISAF